MVGGSLTGTPNQSRVALAPYKYGKIEHDTARSSSGISRQHTYSGGVLVVDRTGLLDRDLFSRTYSGFGNSQSNACFFSGWKLRRLSGTMHTA